MRLIDADDLIDNILDDSEQCDNFRHSRKYYADDIINEFINKAPIIMQWVRVEDNLPNQGQRCIVFIAYDDYETNMRIVKWLGVKASFYEGLSVKGKITHWMELPKTPTEVQNEY